MNIIRYLDRIMKGFGKASARQGILTAENQNQLHEYTFSCQLPKHANYPYKEIQQKIALFPWCVPSHPPNIEFREEVNDNVVEISFVMISLIHAAHLESQILEIIARSSEKKEDISS